MIHENHISEDVRKYMRNMIDKAVSINFVEETVEIMPEKINSRYIRSIPTGNVDFVITGTYRKEDRE